MEKSIDTLYVCAKLQSPIKDVRWMLYASRYDNARWTQSHLFQPKRRNALLSKIWLRGIYYILRNINIIKDKPMEMS